MLRTVDRINGFVIQKVTTPTRVLLGYQIVPENMKVFDSSLVKRFAHLSTARVEAHKLGSAEFVQEAMAAS